MFRLLFCLLPLALLAAGCGDAASATAGDAESPEPRVRVRVVEDAAAVTLDATRPPTLAGDALPGPVRLDLVEGPVRLALDADGWQLGDQRLPRGELVLEPLELGTLAVDGKRFRGRLVFVPRSRDRFDVVNHLGVEGYLMGVLPGEIPGHWDVATHAAQAVVARTYAIYELKTAGPGRGHYDLHADTRSQVYGGLDAENAKARDAVRLTAGQVAVHPTPEGPRIFKAYFHSTSGGVTLGNDVAFAEESIEPLSAQYLGDLGAASGRFTWDPVYVDKAELTRRFRLWGRGRGHALAEVATVADVEVETVNGFGRPTRYVVTDARNRRFSLGPEEIRWATNTDRRGGPLLYSGWFRPIVNETNVVFADGRGWGHGVGMCQWSAQGMAEAGLDYRRIVTASYPGTSVVRAY